MSKIEYDKDGLMDDGVEFKCKAILHDNKTVGVVYFNSDKIVFTIFVGEEDRVDTVYKFTK